MQRHLNTLYITTENSWVNKDGANVVVSVDGVERGRVPVHMIGSIVCVGRVSVSPPLMGFCTEQGVSIAYLTHYGRFLARVEGPVSGNVLLRREQYRRADSPDATAALARSIVIAKTLNQRTVLRRALRDHQSAMTADAVSALNTAEARLSDVARRCLKPQTTDELRGLEGEAARCYFAVFDHLIVQQKEAFAFKGRTRRPPLDAVNALLSLLYTLLTHDCRSACEAFGLDPAVGFLHRDRPGRPSLALDLMEELRPVIADRVALSLINRRQVSTSDFQTLENGAVLLNDDARKTVLTVYQERKKENIQHPFLDEPASFGLMPYLQAQLLARHLRGDLDAYPPFVWK
ncbi:MAG: type I-C CRISPR-associated endonuclease Cas1c [Alphaproteobacteria bacterium]|nr:type I-C CRISPR-associated endonuclease Cas1c [Alphaproteobacteria bacterium]